MRAERRRNSLKGTSKNIAFPRAMAFDADIQFSRAISAPSALF
jgi:hypothetical protein